MLLFPQKATANNDPNGRQFCVLSSRSEVNELLSAQFRLAGFNAVKELVIPGEYLGNTELPENTSGVVVDIGSCTDVETITHSLQAIIPRQVWCCVVGDSDSIALSQSFLNNNIHYFNIGTQLDLIVQAAVYGIEAKIKRKAVSISVLGCKGGVGSTTIGYQLASEVARIKKIPTLFIQGADGSRDLDLHFGKKLMQEITPAMKNFDLMVNSGDQYPDLDQDVLRGYNFVLFEQAINTADKEQLRHLIEHSVCLVLILDRSMSSIRVARNMIENVELMHRTSRVARRLCICLSDTRPVPMNALTSDDIQSLLGRQIDVLFPYNREVKAGKPSQGLFSRRQNPLDNLTHYVLGTSVKTKRSLLGSVMAKKHKRSQ